MSLRIPNALQVIGRYFCRLKYRIIIFFRLILTGNVHYPANEKILCFLVLSHSFTTLFASNW